MSGLAMRSRPIFGGAFGAGEFELASIPAVVRGLHVVQYMVVQPRDGLVLAVASERGEALAAARRRLRDTGWQGEAANDADYPRQGVLWPEHESPAAPAAARHVSRRRREIFQRSQGRCMYCSDALQLDGPWHIEHQLPRALGGDDRPLNLVAACVECNFSKSDRTALEFVADVAP